MLEKMINGIVLVVRNNKLNFEIFLMKIFFKWKLVKEW